MGGRDNVALDRTVLVSVLSSPLTQVSKLNSSPSSSLVLSMQAKSTRKRILKFVIRTTAILLMTVIIWYGQARVFKASRAVSIVQLGESSELVTGDLVVAGYNVAHARGPETGADNWKSEKRAEPLTHLQAIADQIVASNASIVVLNEIDFNAKWSDGLNQARIIADKAGFPYLVTQRNFDVTFPFFTLQFGNAILSKYPIKDATFLKFPARSRKEDIFAGNHDGMVVTVQLQDGPVRIVAVHLEYRDEETRVGAANVISDLVTRESSTPLIAIGDFNAAPEGYPGHEKDQSGNNAIDLLLGEAGMQTILPKDVASIAANLTFPSTQPDRVIDWILVSPSLSLKERRTVSSDLSDHCMVVGVIERDI